tara:strand:+ start:13349 stop:13603 length:255 start_codon:yes stop_codon:yes gene_type:complete
MKEIKDENERKYQVKNLLIQLNQFNIQKNIFPELKDFHEACKDYVQNGNARSGKIYLEVVKRDLEYILPMSKHVDAKINLKCKK